MKVAVLADIHSNHIALSACLERLDAEKPDAVVLLGDYISDFPYPQKTLKLLEQMSVLYKTYVVKGNREEYMISHKNGENEWSYCSQTGSLLYTYENLTEKNIRDFEKLPVSDVVSLNGFTFGISHGGLQNSRDLILPCDGTAEEFLKTCTTDVHFLGHSHSHFVYKSGGKTLVNPGAVGVPISGEVGARFAVAQFYTSECAVRLLNVKYDTDAVIKEFSQSGLLEKANVWSRTMIANITTGRHYNEECIKIVRTLSRERNLPFGTEDLWQEAAALLGI